MGAAPPPFSGASEIVGNRTVGHLARSALLISSAAVPRRFNELLVVLGLRRPFFDQWR
jgi:hypothetical protein